jgi:hypothetical protein
VSSRSTDPSQTLQPIQKLKYETCLHILVVIVIYEYVLLLEIVLILYIFIIHH